MKRPLKLNRQRKAGKCDINLPAGLHITSRITHSDNFSQGIFRSRILRQNQSCRGGPPARPVEQCLRRRPSCAWSRRNNVHRDSQAQSSESSYGAEVTNFSPATLAHTPHTREALPRTPRHRSGRSAFLPASSDRLAPTTRSVPCAGSATEW